MLGEKLDEEVKHYLKAVREGGVVTTAITMAAATAIVRKSDRNLLSENGGLVSITVNWAKSLLYRMGFVKRRGSTTIKLTVNNFDRVKEQFLFDIQTAVEMEDIPPQLVFNWDHTGISIVPVDLSVNKAAKEFMCSQFREWYASEVQKQLDDGAQQISPIDLKMSTMKLLGAGWLVSLHDYIKEHNSLVTNGFKAAGIL